MSSLRAIHHQTTTSDSAISRPGTTPATKSFRIETSAVTPKSTKPTDGGMQGAMIPVAAINPHERLRS